VKEGKQHMVFQEAVFGLQRRLHLVNQIAHPRHGKFVLSARSEAGGAGVYCHFQVIEDQTHIESEFSHFLRHAVDAFGLDDADGEAA
jgi:hypothetical protein